MGHAAPGCRSVYDSRPHVDFHRLGVAAERTLGSDAEAMEIDEVLGQMIALWYASRSRPWILAGFLLIRLFDLRKSLGVRAAQRLPGGWGIVIDDVMAGLHALAVLQAALRFGPRGG